MKRVIPQFSAYLIDRCGVVSNRATGFIYKQFLVKSIPSISLCNDLGKRVTRTIHGLVQLTFPEDFEISITNTVYHEGGSFLNCSDNPLEWTEIQLKLRRYFNYNILTGFLTDSAGTRVGWEHDGYREVYFDGKEYKEHRLIVLYMLGKFPTDNAQVDHINHIGTDNRWDNLRIVSKSTNSRNMPKYSTNSSGDTGVSWHKKQQKWVARIMVNKKPIQLGSFDSKEEARQARKEAELKYKFHENHGN